MGGYGPVSTAQHFGGAWSTFHRGVFYAAFRPQHLSSQSQIARSAIVAFSKGGGENQNPGSHARDLPDFNVNGRIASNVK